MYFEETKTQVTFEKFILKISLIGDKVWWTKGQKSCSTSQFRKMKGISC